LKYPLQHNRYARDISKKIRSAKQTKALNGQHSGSRAVYGYLKDPDNKGKLIVDEDAAEVVRQIFQMAADGLGTVQITTRLAKARIKSPIAREYERTGKFGKNYDPVFPWDWESSTVAKILHNPMYLGHMVNHMQTNKSFKNRKLVNVPREDWIIVENTHPAIVSQELFDRVSKIAKVKKTENTTGFDNIFSGLLYCADCNRVLGFNHKKRPKLHIYYNCTRYRLGTRSGESRLCSPHNISYDNITATLQTYIKMAVNATIDIEAFVQNLRANSGVDAENKRALERYTKRGQELKALIKKVFEQNALGNLDNNTFVELCGGYQAEQREITDKIAECESRISDTRYMEDNARRFAEATAKYTGAEELTREMLLDLVEKVVVHEANGKIGTMREQTVDIYFRFIGKLP
jgi:hypothetical protein